MPKKTTLDLLETDAEGNVFVRFSITDDDGSKRYHRTSMPLDHNIEMQMAAVNAHLAALGYPAVSVSDMSRIKWHAVQTWTPAVRAAHAKKLAAQANNQNA